MGYSSVPWQPGDRLPSPTRNLDQARADLREFGYCIMPNVLSLERLETLRTRLEEQAQAEIEGGIAFEDQGPGQNWSSPHDNASKEMFTAANGGINQRVWMLVNKGQVFRDIVTEPSMLPLVEFLLGPCFQLSTLSANIAKPGGTMMGLHTDQWWLPRPLPRDKAPVAPGAMKRGEYYGPDDGDSHRAINPPCACNIVYCLNDFTEANGATRLVPKSHLTGLQPPPDVPHTVPTTPATGEAGTAILFEGRLWHGTGSNRSNSPRLGLLSTYCGPQFRPQENFTIGLDPKVRDEASSELLAILGFGVWNAYGRTGNPHSKFADPQDAFLGEMTPNA